jgi:UDP-3-O-[3-hydroxymyristoyl] glucosamine N-acyltransferase
MITLENIINLLSPIRFIGNVNQEVKHVCALGDTDISPSYILWVSDKNISKISEVPNGTIICSELALSVPINKSCAYIIVKNPRLAFQKILTNFFVEKNAPAISTTAIIDPSVKIGINVNIGHSTVIEKNCLIGDNVEIGHNNSILANTIIGNNVKIGSNNTIGGVGFGYEKSEDGEYELIPHIGGVKIDEDVEIGNNTCIDRAVLGYTHLMKNCKIDNLVHIAHGVTIGENSLIIANAMVAGSAMIGKNVWVAPSASIINKANVGDNAVIGMGAVVLKNVDENAVVVGNPAKSLVKP